MKVINFIFDENLPESVLRASFEFKLENNPDYRKIAYDINITNKTAIVEVPNEATHIGAIHFSTFSNEFTYFFKDEGRALSLPPTLPPMTPPSTGNIYAGGLIISSQQTDNYSDDKDVTLLKGTVLEMIEKRMDYNEANKHGLDKSISRIREWNLPTIEEMRKLRANMKYTNQLLTKNGGSTLSEDEYWCFDNSVADLGVTFDMTSGEIKFVSKDKPRQTRLVLRF